MLLAQGSAPRHDVAIGFDHSQWPPEVYPGSDYSPYIPTDATPVAGSIGFFLIELSGAVRSFFSVNSSLSSFSLIGSCDVL